MSKMIQDHAGASVETSYSRLVSRIEAVAQISAAEKAGLQSLLQNRLTLRRGADFIKDGKPPTAMYMVERGWAVRYAITTEGRRQIMNVALPGDLVGYHCALIGLSHYSAAPLTETTLAVIEPAQFTELLTTHPGLGRAFSRMAAAELAALRVQTVRLGRLSAEQRIAHFLTELWHRGTRAGIVRNGSMPMPMTQTDISDTLGLSLVHTNRQLQALKRSDLIILKRDRLKVLDPTALARLGDYRPLPA